MLTGERGISVFDDLFPAFEVADFNEVERPVLGFQLFNSRIDLFGPERTFEQLRVGINAERADLERPVRGRLCA